MIQEAAHIATEINRAVDPFVFWEVTAGISALVGYIIWNERYQHRQDLALLKLESDRDNHRDNMEDFDQRLDKVVEIVTRIDRLVRRIAVKNDIHVREDD